MWKSSNLISSGFVIPSSKWREGKTVHNNWLIIQIFSSFIYGIPIFVFSSDKAIFGIPIFVLSSFLTRFYLVSQYSHPFWQGFVLYPNIFFLSDKSISGIPNLFSIPFFSLINIGHILKASLKIQVFCLSRLC